MVGQASVIKTNVDAPKQSFDWLPCAVAQDTTCNRKEGFQPSQSGTDGTPCVHVRGRELKGVITFKLSPVVLCRPFQGMSTDHVWPCFSSRGTE